MSPRLVSLARYVGLGVLCLGLSLGCGGGSTTEPPTPPKAKPDAARSKVEVDKSSDVAADGKDTVAITITVRQSDGTPMSGRTVHVEVSGDGNTVTQPAAKTDAQGVTRASVVSTRPGLKTVTASVDAEGGAVVLSSRPTLGFIAPRATALAFTATALSATAGAPVGGLDVAVRDADGHAVSGATDEVTLSLASGPGGAALEGSLKVRAVDGVAHFSEVVLKKAGTGYALKAEATGLTTATSPGFAVTPGTAVKLEVADLSATVVAGSEEGATVTLRDAFDNVATTYTGTVAVSSTDATATLPAARAFTAEDAGQHTFSGIVLKKAGEASVTFQDASNPALTATQALGVVPGLPRKLAFGPVASQVSVRKSLGVVKVTLQDAFGNPTVVGTPQVTVALVQSGATLGGIPTVAPVDGVASFTSLSVDAEGTFQLRATAGTLEAATSGDVTVVDDVPPAKPVLSQKGATRTEITVGWTAVGDDDAQGTVSSQELRYASTPITTDAAFAAATPVTTGAPAEAGTAQTALIQGLTAGTTYHVALKVTDSAGLSARSDSLAVSTQDPGVSQLAFETEPVDGTSGSDLQPVRVALQDDQGHTVTTATSTVTLTLTGVDTFPAVTVAAVNGVATFSGLRVDKADTYTFTASLASPAVSVTSRAFTVHPGDAMTLELVGLVAPVVAGAKQTLDVTLKDAAGNVATGYTGTVHFESSDPAAELPPDTAFTAADKGHKVFTDGAVLKTAGSQSVTATDTGMPTLTDTRTVEVGSAGAEALALEGLPSSMQAGASQTLTVTAKDRFGNLFTGYRGTVHFTSTDPGAELPLDTAFTVDDAGRKEFRDVVLKTAGPRSVTVTDGTLTASASTDVGAGDAQTLSLELASLTPEAGAAVTATVTLKDAFGNPASSYRGTVHFSADDRFAEVPPDYAFTADDAGRHSFTVTFGEAVQRTLTATDPGNVALTDNVQVTPVAGPVKALALNAPEGPYTAGVAVSVEVVAQDRFGNVNAGYTGTVRASSTDAQAVLPGDYAFGPGDSGRHALDVTFRTAGTQTVTFADTADATVKASHEETVDAADPKVLAITSAPTAGEVRQSLANLVVELRDSYGNKAPVSAPDVTVALVGSGGALSGNPTKSPSGGGVTFAGLQVDGEGTYQLQVTADGLTGATSGDIVISDTTRPAAPTDLSATTLSSTSIRVDWTATGDDGSAGRAQRYELRYATTAITEATFGSATLVSGVGAPGAPGSAESVTVSGLGVGTTYHFALKVFDGAENGSVLAVTSQQTNDPCAGYTCAPQAPTCAADGVTRVTYTATCVVSGESPSCDYAPVSVACTGTDAVCFAGACDTAPKPAAGELVISEVMHTPSVGTTEYIELTNPGQKLLNVAGLTVSYDNGAGTVNSFSVDVGAGNALVVGKGGTLVLAQNKDAASNGGVSADYGYGVDFALGNTGSLSLKAGATVVDGVNYAMGFPQTTGRAMTLASTLVGTKASAYPWYWCDAVQDIVPGGDRGSPNRTNDTCDAVFTAPVDYCAIQSPKTIPGTIEANTPQVIYSRFYDPQVTNRNQNGNDSFPYIQAELGYGTSQANPDGWTWVPASFNAGYAGAAPNDDEMQATLQIPSGGSYFYGFRYRFTNGATPSAWAYCDQNGTTVPPSGTWGTVTVSKAPLTNHVVISELCGGNGSGTAATDEFIELYNPTNADVDLSNWTVQYKSATGPTYSSSVTIPAGKTIKAHGYFLLAGANYSVSSVPSDVSYSFDMSASTTAGGHVRIGPGLVATNTNDPNTVDKVGWGTGNQPEGTAAPSHPAVGGSLERKAVTTSTSATMNGADAARGNGSDTDNNSIDFVTRAARQPQNSSSPLEFY